MFTTNLRSAVGCRENIIWQGRPQKKCFIFESIFNPMLPWALIFGLVDFGILGAALFTSFELGGASIVIVPCMLLHLMPVWMYLGGILLIAKKYRNTEYIITDRGVYISGGSFTYSYEMKPFAELSHIGMHRGFFDQMLGVGDVVMSSAYTDDKGNRKKFTICDIPDFERVYQMVKDMQTDIYSDTMYPNEFRPEQNPGYNTHYSKVDEYRQF